MTFVGTGTAAHTGIKKKLEGTEALQTAFQPIADRLFPSVRQLPIGICCGPFTGIRKTKIFEYLRFAGKAPVTVTELDRQIPPLLAGLVLFQKSRFFLFELLFEL